MVIFEFKATPKKNNRKVVTFYTRTRKQLNIVIKYEVRLLHSTGMQRASGVPDLQYRRFAVRKTFQKKLIQY